MVAGSRIKCSDFCLRVGELSGSSAPTRGRASRSVVKVPRHTGCGRGVTPQVFSSIIALHLHLHKHKHASFMFVILCDATHVIVLGFV
jgi:hypothetical protein